MRKQSGSLELRTNSNIRSRTSVIEAVKSPLGYYVLALLIIEFLIGGVALAIPAYQGSLLLAFGAFFLLLIAIVTTAAFFRPEILYPPSQVPGSLTVAEILCEDLANREGLYRKASEIIDGAKVVLDTTWGPGAHRLSKLELNARNAYIEAQTHALKRGGNYWELFMNSPTRKDRVESAIALRTKHSNYRIAILNDPPA